MPIMDNADAKVDVDNDRIGMRLALSDRRL